MYLLGVARKHVRNLVFIQHWTLLNLFFARIEFFDRTTFDHLLTCVTTLH